jgi:hypothetical protein
MRDRLLYGLLVLLVPIIYYLGVAVMYLHFTWQSIYYMPPTTGGLDFEARVLQFRTRVTCPHLGPFGPFGLGPSVFVRSPIRSKPLEWRSCLLGKIGHFKGFEMANFRILRQGFQSGHLQIVPRVSYETPYFKASCCLMLPHVASCHHTCLCTLYNLNTQTRRSGSGSSKCFL